MWICDSDGLFGFFFFKQKTAYEMRISDWSSDVCSSDLEIAAGNRTDAVQPAPDACRASGREPAMMRAIACALAIATVPLLVAAAPTPRVHSIVIDKMKFGPAPAELRAGDTILWVNKDLFRHTATARDGSFNRSTEHTP